MTFFDHANTILTYSFKAITGVACLVWFDADKRKIFDNSILVLMFLFCRACVVESEYQSAFAQFVCKIVVELCSFHASNMEVPTVLNQ